MAERVEDMKGSNGGSEPTGDMYCPSVIDKVAEMPDGTVEQQKAATKREKQRLNQEQYRLREKKCKAEMQKTIAQLEETIKEQKLKLKKQDEEMQSLRVRLQKDKQHQLVECLERKIEQLGEELRKCKNCSQAKEFETQKTFAQEPVTASLPAPQTVDGTSHHSIAQQGTFQCQMDKKQVPVADVMPYREDIKPDVSCFACFPSPPFAGQETTTPCISSMGQTAGYCDQGAGASGYSPLFPPAAAFQPQLQSDSQTLNSFHERTTLTSNLMTAGFQQIDWTSIIEETTPYDHWMTPQSYQTARNSPDNPAEFAMRANSENWTPDLSYALPSHVGPFDAGVNKPQNCHYRDNGDSHLPSHNESTDTILLKSLNSGIQMSMDVDSQLLVGGDNSFPQRRDLEDFMLAHCDIDGDSVQISSTSGQE